MRTFSACFYKGSLLIPLIILCSETWDSSTPQRGGRGWLRKRDQARRARPAGYLAHKGDRKTNDGKEEKDFTAAAAVAFVARLLSSSTQVKIRQSHSLKVLNTSHWDYIFPLERDSALEFEPLARCGKFWVLACHLELSTPATHHTYDISQQYYQSN